MKKTAQISSATTLFCDDLRLEQGGKLSAMGIYQGHMALPEPEMLLAKLVAWTAISLAPGWQGGQVRVSLLDQDTLLTEAHFDVPAVSADHPSTTLNIPLEMIPFKAKVGASLRITVQAPGLNHESQELHIVALAVT